MRHLSLAVVGADHPNRRGPTRRFEIAITKPGDRVTLHREPKNKHDERAVAVLSPNGVQIGYLSAERAALIAPMLDRRRTATAILQRKTTWGCWIRVAFDGEVPSIEGLSQPENEDQERDLWPGTEWQDD